MTHKELIKACQKGNESAKKEIYQLFAGKMMGLCVRYSKNIEEAEDIFQEGFIKVFQNIKKLKDSDLLEPWMKRIFINTAINYYHKEKKHYYHSDSESLETSHDDSESVIDQISQQELLGLIEKLPQGCRIVFNLYIMEGYKHDEIAKMLEISLGTSKSQLSRAKILLRKELNGLGINGFIKTY
ncbi:MAG: RNA polymerase sigma factor (sigma-70 family) [Arenicella sp.]|jgi:RNA polymerase sigma factor (sigma-70 family)